MPAELLMSMQLAIGMTYAWSALAKGVRPRTLANGLHAYYLIPQRLVDSVGIGLIIFEAFAALSHLTGLLLYESLPFFVGALLSFGFRRGQRCPRSDASVRSQVSDFFSDCATK